MFIQPTISTLFDSFFISQVHGALIIAQLEYQVKAHLQVEIILTNYKLGCNYKVKKDVCIKKSKINTYGV